MDGPNTQKGTKEGFQGALDLSILFDAFVKNKCLFKNMLYNKSFLGLCQCYFSQSELLIIVISELSRSSMG